MRRTITLQGRERTIEIVERRLSRESMPRLQMSVILILTGLIGFLASVALLHLNVSQMWIRYPIAIAVAYGVFLMFLRVWLWFHGRESNCDLDYVDLPLELIDGEGLSSGESVHFGGGGHFCGGGAGGSWGESVARSASSTGNSASSGFSFDLDLDLDGLVFLIIAGVALIGALIPVLYVIYIAPVFLAEILIDGVLLVGLYKRVKKVDHRHWLRAAVRRTVIPASLGAALFSIAGFALQKAVPVAHSIGDVWRHIT